MNHQAYRRGYFITVVIFSVLSFAISLYNGVTIGMWGALTGLSSFAFLLIPPVASWLFRFRRSYLVDSVLLIFIFLAFDLGVALRWYHIFEYYDLLMHGLSGFVFTLLGLCALLYLREDKSTPFGKDGWLNAVGSLSISALIACVWEIGEFIVYKITGSDVQRVLETGVDDTMEDIIICLAGSLIMALFLVWRMKTGRARGLFLPAEDFYGVNQPNSQRTNLRKNDGKE